MPMMTVQHPPEALSATQKDALAEDLTQVILQIEGGADTPAGRSIAWVRFQPISRDDWYLGGRNDAAFEAAAGRWLIELNVPEGSMNQDRKSECHRAITAAILGITGKQDVEGAARRSGCRFSSGPRAIWRRAGAHRACSGLRGSPAFLPITRCSRFRARISTPRIGCTIRRAFRKRPPVARSCGIERDSTMTTPIEFYYDFISPYSYFAFAQRDEIRARTGRELRLRPVSVGMIMKAVGNVPTSVTCKAKRRYLDQDLTRWVRKLGIPFAPHPKFGAFSTAPLIQAALAAGDDVEAFSAAAFTAVWVEQAPVDDAVAMREWFASQNACFANYWDARDRMDADLVERVAEAVNVGAFGEPYFHTDRGDFFGNDRIDVLIETLPA